MEANQDFLQLVEEHQVQIPQLSLVCSAPIKVLLSWYEYKEEVPEYALVSLKKFLGLNED